MQHDFRYVPFIRNVKIRTTIGFILLLLSTISAKAILGKGRIEVIFSITAVAWIFAIFLTDKYVHKYPQRYFTYLIASHLKAAIIMAFFLWIIGRIAGLLVAPQDVLWTGYVFFVFADAIVSVFHRRDIPDRQSSVLRPSLCTEDITDDRSSDSSYNNAGLSSIDTQAIAREIRSHLDKTLVEFIETNLPGLNGDNGDVLFLDDVTTIDDQSKPAPVALLVGRTRMNDVLRLNRFLMFCTRRITMGGFIVLRYMPLENVIKDFKRRYTGLLYWMVFIPHFIWYRAIPNIPWLDTLYF